MTDKHTQHPNNDALDTLWQYFEKGQLKGALNFLEQLSCHQHHVKDLPEYQWMTAFCCYRLSSDKDHNSQSIAAQQLHAAIPTDERYLWLAYQYWWVTSNYAALIQYCRLCLFQEHRLSQKAIADAWSWLAKGHCSMGELRAGIAAYKKAQAILPNDAQLMLYRSLALLESGEYEEGFTLYDVRLAPSFGLNWITSAKLPMPQWRGESLQGKSLLLWSEQGLGDTLQFSRFAAWLSEQGAEVDILLRESHSTLENVVEHVSGVNRVYVERERRLSVDRMHDFHCPLMSLMLGIIHYKKAHNQSLGKDFVIDHSIQTLLTPEPYISAPFFSRQYAQLPALQTMSVNRSAQAPRLQVAIVWRSTNYAAENPDGDKAAPLRSKVMKSVDLQQMENVLQQDGVDIFSLQFEPSPEEQALLARYHVYDCSPEIEDFSHTAAIISTADIVISIDTAVAHLAGAMGKPVINLLPFVADWRWESKRDDSVWYPSMLLYRQVWLNDWDQVLLRLSRTLEQTVLAFQQSTIHRRIASSANQDKALGNISHSSSPYVVRIVEPVDQYL